METLATVWADTSALPALFVGKGKGTSRGCVLLGDEGGSTGGSSDLRASLSSCIPFENLPKHFHHATDPCTCLLDPVHSRLCGLVLQRRRGARAKTRVKFSLSLLAKNEEKVTTALATVFTEYISLHVRAAQHELRSTAHPSDRGTNHRPTMLHL